MKAVIVKFANGKYSIKTTRKCFWCSSTYYESEQQARRRNIGLNFYPKVINELDYNGIALFNKRVDKLLKTNW